MFKYAKAYKNARENSISVFFHLSINFLTISQQRYDIEAKYYS